jgi:lipopolysaccharide transport system ATP-binding protein
VSNASTAPSISVRNVSKKFARSLKRAMAYGLTDVARVAFMPGRGAGDTEATDENLRPSEFWALRDVSFDVAPGECLGIIGHNGAGKSTLFSILSGIYGPSAGTVTVRGRLQALIALGAGFHPMLTGRENIYINGSILGMRTREIDRIVDTIVDFSELRDFIDTPIKNYSSGMLVRLGFSVAVHTKPDILLVDEVLAVGDLAFQNKSFDRMMKIVRSGVPVVFVSHSMRAIETICSRVIWLDHGQVRKQGETGDVVEAYVKAMELASAVPAGARAASGLFPIAIERVECADEHGAPARVFAWKQPIRIRLHYTCRDPVANPYFFVNISRPGREQASFLCCHMMYDGIQWNARPGTGSVECDLPGLPLAPGHYEIRCGIGRTPTSLVGQKYYQEEFVGGGFEVSATPAEMSRPGLLRATSFHIPPLAVNHRWRYPSDNNEAKGFPS